MSDHPRSTRWPRSIAGSGLPHPILVDIARARSPTAIRAARPDHALAVPPHPAEPRCQRHQPAAAHQPRPGTDGDRAIPAHPQTIEFDLASGERGPRRTGGRDLSQTPAEADGSDRRQQRAAPSLVLATLAAGRDVAVSRGESVEIGGAFRVPAVLEQSGAPTRRRRDDEPHSTVRLRAGDHPRPGDDVAVVLKVHPSNYRADGFVETTPVADLATPGNPLVVDIGSGLIDADVPWLGGPPPAWLAGEPAAVQTLGGGARRDVQRRQAARRATGRDHRPPSRPRRRCAKHPLARALRCGGT